MSQGTWSCPPWLRKGRGKLVNGSNTSESRYFAVGWEPFCADGPLQALLQQYVNSQDHVWLHRGRFMYKSCVAEQALLNLKEKMVPVLSMDDNTATFVEEEPFCPHRDESENEILHEFVKSAGPFAVEGEAFLEKLRQKPKVASSNARSTGGDTVPTVSVRRSRRIQTTVAKSERESNKCGGGSRRNRRRAVRTRTQTLLDKHRSYLEALSHEDAFVFRRNEQYKPHPCHFGSHVRSLSSLDNFQHRQQLMTAIEHDSKDASDTTELRNKLRDLGIALRVHIDTTRGDMQEHDDHAFESMDASTLLQRADTMTDRDVWVPLEALPAAWLRVLLCQTSFIRIRAVVVPFVDTAYEAMDMTELHGAHLVALEMWVDRARLCEELGTSMHRKVLLHNVLQTLVETRPSFRVGELSRRLAVHRSWLKQELTQVQNHECDKKSCFAPSRKRRCEKKENRALHKGSIPPSNIVSSDQVLTHVHGILQAAVQFEKAAYAQYRRFQVSSSERHWMLPTIGCGAVLQGGSPECERRLLLGLLETHPRTYPVSPETNVNHGGTLVLCAGNLCECEAWLKHFQDQKLSTGKRLDVARLVVSEDIDQPWAQISSADVVVARACLLEGQKYTGALLGTVQSIMDMHKNTENDSGVALRSLSAFTETGVPKAKASSVLYNGAHAYGFEREMCQKVTQHKDLLTLARVIIANSGSGAHMTSFQKHAPALELTQWHRVVVVGDLLLEAVENYHSPVRWLTSCEDVDTLVTNQPVFFLQHIGHSTLLESSIADAFTTDVAHKYPGAHFTPGSRSASCNPDMGRVFQYHTTAHSNDRLAQAIEFIGRRQWKKYSSTLLESLIFQHLSSERKHLVHKLLQCKVSAEQDAMFIPAALESMIALDRFCIPIRPSATQNCTVRILDVLLHDAEAAYYTMQSSVMLVEDLHMMPCIDPTNSLVGDLYKVVQKRCSTWALEYDLVGMEVHTAQDTNALIQWADPALCTNIEEGNIKCDALRAQIARLRKALQADSNTDLPSALRLCLPDLKYLFAVESVHLAENKPFQTTPRRSRSAKLWKNITRIVSNMVDACLDDVTEEDSRHVHFLAVHSTSVKNSGVTLASASEQGGEHEEQDTDFVACDWTVPLYEKHLQYMTRCIESLLHRIECDLEVLEDKQSKYMHKRMCLKSYIDQHFVTRLSSSPSVKEVSSSTSPCMQLEGICPVCNVHPVQMCADCLHLTCAACLAVSMQHQSTCPCCGKETEKTAYVCADDKEKRRLSDELVVPTCVRNCYAWAKTMHSNKKQAVIVTRQSRSLSLYFKWLEQKEQICIEKDARNDTWWMSTCLDKLDAIMQNMQTKNVSVVITSLPKIKPLRGWYSHVLMEAPFLPPRYYTTSTSKCFMDKSIVHAFRSTICCPLWNSVHSNVMIDFIHTEGVLRFASTKSFAKMFARELVREKTCYAIGQAASHKKAETSGNVVNGAGADITASLQPGSTRKLAVYTDSVALPCGAQESHRIHLPVYPKDYFSVELHYDLGSNDIVHTTKKTVGALVASVDKDQDDTTDSEYFEDISENQSESNDNAGGSPDPTTSTAEADSTDDEAEVGFSLFEYVDSTFEAIAQSRHGTDSAARPRLFRRQSSSPNVALQLGTYHGLNLSPRYSEDNVGVTENANDEHQNDQTDQTTFNRTRASRVDSTRHEPSEVSSTEASLTQGAATVDIITEAEEEHDTDSDDVFPGLDQILQLSRTIQ